MKLFSAIRPPSSGIRPPAPSGRRAFTIIETLVVIGITTIICAAAIVYSKVGQNQVAITVETSKIAELVLQARQLALATYSSGSGMNQACAYGIHFDFPDQTYSLFAYIAATTTATGDIRCPSLASTTQTMGLPLTSIGEYSPGTWEQPLTQGVKLVSPTDQGAAADILTDVMFYPPDPQTLITRDDKQNNGGTFLSPTLPSTIYLETTDGKSQAQISVSPEGQVSF